MALYSISNDGLTELAPTKLQTEGLRERDDLQRLLRDCPQAIEDGLYIVDEEFSSWTEGSRRIDLLAVDREARLVVIELKRDDESGFMELQALRYAAMVASMTFEQIVHAHAGYLGRRGSPDDARERLLAHLQWNADGEPQIDSVKPRIILVSGSFSRELTTSALWLNNDVGLDVRCVRMRLYRVNEQLVLDASQLIPLPEAEDYLVRVREKTVELEQSAARFAEWTREELELLRPFLRNPTVLALFDLGSSRPNEWVPFSEILAAGGQTQPQARGALAALTREVRSRTERRHWPIEYHWGAGGEQQSYYRMPAGTAHWWNETRIPSTEGEPSEQPTIAHSPDSSPAS